MSSVYPVYCTKCGSTLVVSRIFAEEIRPLAYHEYDDISGERMYGHRFICPNKRWWNKGHTDEDHFWGKVSANN